jgi:hypothetical protein
VHFLVKCGMHEFSAAVPVEGRATAPGLDYCWSDISPVLAIGLCSSDDTEHDSSCDSMFLPQQLFDADFSAVVNVHTTNETLKLYCNWATTVCRQCNSSAQSAQFSALQLTHKSNRILINYFADLLL